MKHHHHHHHHEEGSLKSKLYLIGVTIILLIIAVFIEKHYDLATWQLLLVYLIPYLLIGHETLGEAAEGIAKGDMFNEHFLMAIATIGALCIGFFPGAETEFPEAVFVMLFFQVGELFEGYAEGKSRDSISHLMDIRPDVANVIRNKEVHSAGWYRDRRVCLVGYGGVDGRKRASCYQGRRRNLFGLYQSERRTQGAYHQDFRREYGI